MLCITILGHFFNDLNNFLCIWSWETIFGVDKYLIKVPQKMCQKFLSDPQKRPNLQKFLPRRAFLDPKIWTKFYIPKRPNAKMAQKIRAGVLKTSLMLIFTVPMILGHAEISGTLGVFFKIFTCGSKIFKNDPTFKMVKNHHFSTFDDFFFYYGQSGPSFLHLPNFASQKFLHA